MRYVTAVDAAHPAVEHLVGAATRQDATVRSVETAMDAVQDAKDKDHAPVITALAPRQYVPAAVVSAQDAEHADAAMTRPPPVAVTESSVATAARAVIPIAVLIAPVRNSMLMEHLR